MTRLKSVVIVSACKILRSSSLPQTNDCLERQTQILRLKFLKTAFGLSPFVHPGVTVDALMMLLGRRSGAYSARTSSSSILRSRFAAGVPADASAMDGGISVTGSLSNFSLYIFHPYGGGGGQKKATLSSLENTFRKSAAHGGSSAFFFFLSVNWQSCDSST
jgi:hypothetical protein